MAASVPMFALFAGYERVKDRRDGSPLVQLSLFRERAFSVGMAIAVTFFLGIASFALILTLFLQIGLGFEPLHAGLTFLPFSGGVLVASGAAARLAPRLGRGVTMTGALVMAAGMAGLIAIVHHYGVAVTTWEMAPGLVLAGLGMGSVLAPLADILLAGVPRQHAGSASGLLNTGFQVGASIGIAVIGVIFFGLLGSQSGPAATAVAPQLRTGLAAAGVPARFSGPIVTQFRGCLHDRLVAADPTVTPASCQRSGTERALPAAAGRVLAGTGGTAERQAFVGALQRTLWFQVGVLLLSFVLMLALPAGSGRRAEDGAGPEAGASAGLLPAPATEGN